MAKNDVPKSNTSDKKFIFKSIRMDRLNVVMTFTFDRYDNHRRNGNVNMAVSYIIENMKICICSAVLQ